MKTTSTDKLPGHISQFRKTFRETIIPSYYNGHAFIVFLVIVSFSAIIYCAAQIESLTWQGLLISLITIFYCNLHIYMTHRFLLHQRVWGFGWANDMHLIHHKIYDEKNLEYEHINDLYMLLMPPQILLMYYLAYVPSIVLLCSFILPMQLCWCIATTLSAWYLYYELIHFIEHLPSNHFLMKFKYCRFLRSFHSIHHDQKLMNRKHFDIAIPSFDYVFKTNGHM